MTSFPARLRQYEDKFLALDRSRLLLALRSAHQPDAVSKLIQPFGLQLERDMPPRGTARRRAINDTDRRFWVRAISGESISDSVVEKVRALRELDWLGPVYQREDFQGDEAYLSPLPRVLLVEFRRDVPAEQIERVEQRHRLKYDATRSQWLKPFRSYLPDSSEATSYDLRNAVGKEPTVASAHFPSMPMMSPEALVPDDPHYSAQWNLNAIGAPEGWDISDAAAADLQPVVIAVLDGGCEMSHVDIAFDGPGFNAWSGAADGYTARYGEYRYHGTWVAGVAAARTDNDEGVAGLAGYRRSGDDLCRVHAVAIPNYSEDEVLAAINEAADDASAQVINMSFGMRTWNTLIINPGIEHAHNVRGAVLCAAAGNEGVGVMYPAQHALVMAVGATNDRRERHDGMIWHSCYGPELDVMAPGVRIATTKEGDAYKLDFDGTSSSSPHVAGLAALLRSRYPGLTNVDVRRFIESTCQKLPAYTYAVDADHPHGSWNEETGYGRINVHHALDLADTYIKDHPDDDGRVPFTGVFWEDSDVVVTPDDVDDFPAGPARAVRHRANYVYVRVTNLGPATARDVMVTCLAVPYVGAEFTYPFDWTTPIGGRVDPTVITAEFDTVEPGVANAVTAKFLLSEEQIEELHDWIEDHAWHPCVLARVDCENAYVRPVGVHVWEDNKLAQRNVSVALMGELRSLHFPFLIGNRQNPEPFLQLVIDRGNLPQGFTLYLDPDNEENHFPRVELKPRQRPGGQIRFLDRTRLGVSLCGCEGILTLESGSAYDCLHAGHDPFVLEGAQLTTRNGKSCIALVGQRSVIGMSREPGEMRQCVLQVERPPGVTVRVPHRIRISQRNLAGRTVGGVTLQLEPA